MKLSFPPISIMIFPLRMGGYGVMSISALILYFHGQVSGWFGLYAIFTAIIWAPVILFWVSSRPIREGKRMDLWILAYIDPILSGIWLLFVKGSLWYLLFALLGLGTGICSVLGFLMWLRGLIIIGVFWLLAYYLNDFHLMLASPFELTVFALLASTIYTLMIGRAQFNVASRIATTKTELEQVAKDLGQINHFMQMTIASKNLRELAMKIDKYMHEFFGFKSTSLCLLDESEGIITFYDIEKHKIEKIYHKKINELSNKDPVLIGVMNNDKAIVINNMTRFHTNSSDKKDYFMSHEAKSMFVLPLKYCDVKLGCLCLFSDENIESKDEYINKLTSYLNNIAIVAHKNKIFIEFNKSETELNYKNKELKNNSERLSKYVSPQIYQWIFSSKDKIYISSSRKRLTFLVISMQNFYDVLEQLDPDTTTYFVNSYLSLMSKLIVQYGGTIDLYVGLQIRVFFGDPTSLSVKKDALQGLMLAQAMQEAFQHFKAQWSTMLVADLGLRIAVGSGYIDVGNFGSQYRMNYTVIGHMVNLTLRLLIEAKAGQTLMTEDTYLLVKDYVEASKEDGIALRRDSKKTNVYCLKHITRLDLILQES